MSMQRQTIQRRLALDAVNTLGSHPTVEDVYDYTRKTHPSVSKATIYRNLSNLADEGVLRRVRLPDQPVRYETRTSPHFHFCCERCGRIMDLEIDYDIEVDARVAAETGFRIMRHELLFRGLCAECGAVMESGENGGTDPAGKPKPAKQCKPGRPAKHPKQPAEEPTP